MLCTLWWVRTSRTLRSELNPKLSCTCSSARNNSRNDNNRNRSSSIVVIAIGYSMCQILLVRGSSRPGWFRRGWEWPSIYTCVRTRNWGHHYNLFRDILNKCYDSHLSRDLAETLWALSTTDHQESGFRWFLERIIQIFRQELKPIFLRFFTHSAWKICTCIILELSFMKSVGVPEIMR